MRQPHPLGAGWGADFEREWDRIFKRDPPDTRIPRQRRVSYPFKLEDIVRAAIADLRKELGKSWLPNRLYGTRLHAAVRRRLDMATAASSWEIFAEQSLGAIGGLSPRLAQLSVRRFLDSDGKHLDWLRPNLSKDLLESKVGDIKPDLAFARPTAR